MRAGSPHETTPRAQTSARSHSWQRGRRQQQHLVKLLWPAPRHPLSRHRHNLKFLFTHVLPAKDAAHNRYTALCLRGGSGLACGRRCVKLRSKRCIYNIPLEQPRDAGYCSAGLGPGAGAGAGAAVGVNTAYLGAARFFGFGRAASRTRMRLLEPLGLAAENAVRTWWRTHGPRRWRRRLVEGVHVASPRGPPVALASVDAWVERGGCGCTSRSSSGSTRRSGGTRCCWGCTRCCWRCDGSHGWRRWRLRDSGFRLLALGEHTEQVGVTRGYEVVGVTRG